MLYPKGVMARGDPSLEKENLVLRVHKSEPGSGGLGSVRTRGLLTSEQRAQTVLKDSSLRNQTPSAVTVSKTNLGSTEKDWLKNPSSDYSSGKQSAGSLERLREKIGQLKSAGALKSATQKSFEHHRHPDTSTLEHHFVGELRTRSSTPNVSETPVHVYRDEKVSNSGGTQREALKAESQRLKREMNSRVISEPILEHARDSGDQDNDDFEKPISLSTSTKSSSVKDSESMQSHVPTFSNGALNKKKLSASDYLDGSRQSAQNKVDSGGILAGEKQSVSTSLVQKEIKIMDQDIQGKYPESAQNISPGEQEVKGSRESSVERDVEIVIFDSIKFIKSFKHGGAMRVIRDDPRYPRATQGADDQSPGSEKSGDDDQSPGSEKSGDDDQGSPAAPHLSKMTDNHADIQTGAPTILEAGILSASKSNQTVKQNASMQTVEGYLSEHRKRKAEADPSITDTSLLSGVCNDSHISVAIAMEAHEGDSKGINLIQRERERKRERGGESTLKEARTERTALEQSGERSPEDVAGHPFTGTKGAPGHEREPWAWKIARDSRSVALPSPNSHEHSKSGKFIGGIPPRYVPPSAEYRERKAEANISPASDGLQHRAGVLKQTNETEEEPNNGVTPHSNLCVKGLASTDDIAVNHLSDTFSSISIEEKSANGVTKISTEARTLTQVSVHHMNVVPAESGSNTAVTGVTGLSGLTSQSVEIPHKTALTSSHGVEMQRRLLNLQLGSERDRVSELSDRGGLPKSTARSTPTAAEVPAHDVYEGHSAKSSDPPRNRREKNQDIPPQNSQPPRKIRTETENDKFVYVNGIRYQKLGKIGKGGSSEVFKVIATDCSIYALKRINLKGRDWSSAQEFYQEIKYLKALRGKRHIIQLVDSEVTNMKVLENRSGSGDITEEAFIYMVLEYGEIDLAGMLSAKRKEMQSNNETKPDENWLRFYWQQILEAVRTIHDERIVHSDLKPANFMLVRGELKLIDFGIAKAIMNDTTNIVKENQTGTLNYMAPEAFLQNQTDEAGLVIKIGRASDIWSLGCIFYQMVYGHTPFAELSFYSKITAITNPHHKINYPRVSNPWLLDIIKRCFIWDRRKRLRIPELLEHPFIQPHLAPFCSRCEQIYQTLARTPSSERSQVDDSILSSYGTWGHKCVSGNSGHSGHDSPT